MTNADRSVLMLALREICGQAAHLATVASFAAALTEDELEPSFAQLEADFKTCAGTAAGLIERMERP